MKKILRALGTRYFLICAKSFENLPQTRLFDSLLLREKGDREAVDEEFYEIL